MHSTQIARVASEQELDAVEQPVRDAFACFLADVGLLGTDEAVLGLTFKTGGLHFAAKALQFVPPDPNVLVIGTSLTDAEVEFLAASGYPVFNFDQPFDNELVYELLMDHTTGAFGWVDVDCFVLNPAVWRALLAPMADDVGAHAAFTYPPLGFAKTPLVVWDSKARALLQAQQTTLNSYAPVATHVGRSSPYAISRILKAHHYRFLEQVLGVGPDRQPRPHAGLLDVLDNGRTVNSQRRATIKDRFGPGVRRIGWLLDTPMMAGIVLQAHGLATKQVIPKHTLSSAAPTRRGFAARSVSATEICQDVIHVGASGYRERVRQEGAATSYLAQYRLTDLFEVLLADELAQQGLRAGYQELVALQTKRLHDEAGIPHSEIKAAARSMLKEAGLDLTPLHDDPRLSFLF